MSEERIEAAHAEGSEAADLRAPVIRCLNRLEAARYLGVGTTLFDELRVPSVNFGRRRVWDVIDLNDWLDEYKKRGRAGKEVAKWPAKQGRNTTVSGRELIRDSGGSTLCFQTADAYEEALRPRTAKKPKRL